MLTCKITLPDLPHPVIRFNPRFQALYLARQNEFRFLLNKYTRNFFIFGCWLLPEKFSFCPSRPHPSGSYAYANWCQETLYLLHLPHKHQNKWSDQAQNKDMWTVDPSACGCRSAGFLESADWQWIYGSGRQNLQMRNDTDSVHWWQLISDNFGEHLTQYLANPIFGLKLPFIGSKGRLLVPKVRINV